MPYGTFNNITDYLLNRKDFNLDKGRFTNKQKNATTFDNNSTYNYVSIFRGLSIIQTEFGETPDEDDYLENALNCLRLIGNYHIDLYGYSGTTDDDGELCLPVRALSIEYVTDGLEDWTTWSYQTQLSQHYAPGRYIAYKFLGDRVVTDIRNHHLSVAYSAEKMDEDGYPMITEKEAMACAYWWIYVDTRRKVRRGNQIAATYLQQAVFDKNKGVNQARLPEKLSQNLMNDLANIVYSRDRKSYNVDYKPIKLA